MGGADEAGLVRGGGEIDAVGEGVVKEAVEAGFVACDGVFVVADGAVGEEEGEHGARLGDLEGDALIFRGIK